MGVRGGKTVDIIRKTSLAGGVIVTSSEESRDHIIATAIRLGIKPPPVILMARGNNKGISIAEILVDHQEDCKDRPWVDARTHKKVIDATQFTADDVIKAWEDMRKIPVNNYYIYDARWAAPFLSDEEVIEYYADNGSVVVRDSKGRKWRAGKLLEDRSNGT